MTLSGPFGRTVIRHNLPGIMGSESFSGILHFGRVGYGGVSVFGVAGC